MAFNLLESCLIKRSSSLLGWPGDLARAESNEVEDVEASKVAFGLGRGLGRGRADI